MAMMGYVATGFWQTVTSLGPLLTWIALLLPAALVRSVPGGRAARPMRTAAAQAMRSGVPLAPLAPLASLGLGGWAGARRPVWQSADRWASVLREAAKLALAFAAACVGGALLAGLTGLVPPRRWLEVLAATALLWVALNNLYPIGDTARWKLGLLAGAVHGFALGGGLHTLAFPAPLQPGQPAQWLDFAAGLVLALGLIVAVMLPLAWALRRNPIYRGWILRGGSALMGALAAGCLLQFWALPRA